MKETYKEISNIFHSDHPFYLVLKDILISLSYIWNYQVFTTSANQGVTVGSIIIGLLLLVLGLKLAKHLSLWIRRKLLVNKAIDVSLAASFEKISYYLFIVLIVIFIFDITNVPFTAFAVVGTTLALGIGLGSQNVVSNFISGLIIMLERPIKLGDIIEIKSLSVVGEVINIGARCVSVRTEHNINILIPNSNILQDSLINWTLDDTILKTVIPLHIAYNSAFSTLDKVDEILRQALEKNTLILKDPKPQVLLKELSKEGLNLEVEFWINLSSGIDKKYIIDNVNRAIEPLFRQHNIKVAEKIQVKN